MVYSKTKYVIVFFFIFFSGYSQNILSVDEAIKIGIENNYGIKIAEKNKQISQNNHQFSNAGFYPNVNANFAQNYRTEATHQEFIDANRPSTDNPEAKSNSFSSSVSVVWTIFNGLKMFYTYNRLGKMEENAVLEKNNTVQNTIAQILISYYNIVTQFERIRILKETLVISEKRLEIAKNKYEIGRSAKEDFLSAQVDYNSDKSSLLTQENILFSLKADLNSILVRETNTDFIVLPQIDIDSQLVINTFIDNYSNNLNILIAKKQMQIAHIQWMEARADRYPTINVTSGYIFNIDRSQVGIFALTQRNGYNYGVTASVPIFNGRVVERRIQNARIQKEINEYRIKDLEISFQLDIQSIFNTYKTGLELLKLEKQNVSVALENEKNVLERYILGNTTFVVLRQAQVAALQAENRLFTAKFNTKLAEIELLRLSGKLISTYPNN